MTGNAREQLTRLEADIRGTRRSLEQLRNSYLETFRAEITRLENRLRRQEDSLRTLKVHLVSPTPVIQAPRARPVPPVPPPPPRPVPSPAAPPPPPRPVAPPPRPAPVPPPPPRQPVVQVEKPRVRTVLRDSVNKSGIEGFLGEKVLSRIGIIVLLFGIVFFIGYRISSGGAWEKLLAGGVTGIGLVGLGIFLQRKEAFRQFVMPIIGGGWAIFFFTIFASHHIEAAKVVDNPALGFAMLIVVSVAMIGHSLAYRSQLFTGFTYVLAFVALGVSELIIEADEVGAFSVYAVLMLAASLAILRVRLKWRGLMTAGMVCSYAVLLVWLGKHFDAVSAGGTMFSHALVGFGALTAIFKATEWLGGETDTAEALIQLVNSIIGTMFFAFVLGRVYPDQLHWFFTASGVLHAIFAWRLRSKVTQGVFEAGAISAMALIALSLLNGLHETPERLAIGWLVEAEVILGLGLMQKSRLFRGLSMGLFALALIPLFDGGFSFLFSLPFALAALLNTMSVRMQFQSDRARLFETIHWHGVAALAFVLPYESELHTLSFAWLVYAEALLGLGLFIKAREARWVSIGLFLAATGAFIGAAGNGTSSFGMLVALIGLPLVNTLAMARRGAHVGESIPMHLAASIAALCHLDDRPGPLFLTWLVQAEAVLAVAMLLRTQWLRIVAHAIFITSGFALIYAARQGIDSTTALYLLYGTTAVATTLVGRFVRPSDSVGDAEPLVWHLPLAFATPFVFSHNPWMACLALAVHAQVILALAGKNMPMRITQMVVFAGSAVSILWASLAEPGDFELFGRMVPTAVRYLAMLLPIAYVNAHLSKQPVLREIYHYAGAGFLALLIWTAFEGAAVPLLWGAAALVLWEIGFAARNAHFRLQGNLMAAFAPLYLLAVDFDGSGWRTFACLLASAYIWILYWRQGAIRDRSALGEFLRAVNPLLSWCGTAVLVSFLFAEFDRPHLAGTWGIVGVTLMAIGILFDKREIRAQALLLAGFAFVESFFTGFVPDGAGWHRWMSMVVAGGSIFGMAILSDRRMLSDGIYRKVEVALPFVYAFAAAIIIGYMCAVEFERHFLTIAWGVEGLALVVTGLLCRQRMLRYPGLALLVLCIGKIAFVDVMALKVEFRILAFIGLGLMLLAASFAYARFRHVIRAREDSLENGQTV